MRHPSAADGAVMGDQEKVIGGIFVGHWSTRRLERRRLGPSRMSVRIVGLLLDGRIAAVIAQLDAEGVAENARHGSGIDMLAVV